MYRGRIGIACDDVYHCSIGRKTKEKLLFWDDSFGVIELVWILLFKVTIVRRITAAVDKTRPKTELASGVHELMHEDALQLGRTREPR